VEVIVERIKETRPPFYRPALPHHHHHHQQQQADECMDNSAVAGGVLTLMKQCWAEDPAHRPSFRDVARSLRIINHGRFGAIGLFLLLCLLVRSSWHCQW